MIAFDLGTKCGVAWIGETGIAAKLINLSKKGKFSSESFFDFSIEIDELFRSGKFSKVFIEKPHSGPYFHATHILFGLLGILEMKCQAYEIPYALFSPTTIKKFWTGSGRSTKAQMVAKTQENYPTVKDNNISDAIALLEYGMNLETN